MPWLALVPSPACPTPPWPELACRLGRFTPRLVLGESELLAELAGSLRLFGGLSSLRQQIGEDLAAWPVAQAVAATPLAAIWLARSQPGGMAPTLAATRVALESVPLAALQLAPPLVLRLEALGMRHLGEVMALPRAGLGSRLGAGFVRDLGRALGEVVHPQCWFAFPEGFDLQLELPAAVEAAPALLFAARRLVAALAGWLAARNAVVREMEWRIGHGRGMATSLPLAFSEPVQSAARIERVLAEHLGRLRLPAPAVELGLAVARTEPLAARNRALFGRDAGADTEALGEVCDRLLARLGAQALEIAAGVADHRPERATGMQKPGSGVTAGSGTGKAVWDRPRPLWLTEPPQGLVERGGRPHYRNGPLQLLSGPERIESGWWDGAEVRRDYFIARDAEWRWLWIFREAGISGSWFLHGWFA